MKIKINPKKELFYWGPIDGRLIYVDYFNIAFTLFGKRFVRWPNLLGLFEKEKMVFILENQEIYESGRKNFLKYILPENKLKIYKQEWSHALVNCLKISKKIQSTKLKKLDRNKLYGFFNSWSAQYFKFWTIGELPELSNWGGEIILKEILQKFLPASDFTSIFEKLSAPEKLSFYQKTELELLKLKRFKGEVLRTKLQKFQRNHFWILNSYHRTKILPVSHFYKELEKYNNKDASQKIKQLKNLGKKVRKTKQNLQKQFNLSKKIMKTANRLSYCIWWQDLRKFYIFYANHIIDLFLKEFSRRYKINFSKIHDYNFIELRALAKYGKKDNKNPNARSVYYDSKQNRLDYKTNPAANKIISQFRQKKHYAENIKELSGIVVSQGPIVKARAKILHSPKEVKRLKLGEILIASMTSPDFITAIKKASALITDHGGMTSHAAIVSRELKIPCIVGTKIATKVFKDGDMIEVDSNSGTVKKLN